MLDTQTLLTPEETLLPEHTAPLRLDSEPLDILLVEDTFGDVLLTRIALDSAQLPYKLSTLKRGNQVLPYLEKYRTRRPDVIMLDLGLPGMDGFEILAGLAENPLSIRSIPIVILTGHKDFEYISDNFPLCIMAYIHKPCSAGCLREVLARIKSGKHSGPGLH